MSEKTQKIDEGDLAELLALSEGGPRPRERDRDLAEGWQPSDGPRVHAPAMSFLMSAQCYGRLVAVGAERAE